LPDGLSIVAGTAASANLEPSPLLTAALFLQRLDAPEIQIADFGPLRQTRLRSQSEVSRRVLPVGNLPDSIEIQ
jgi:hypothetical protein